MEYYIVVKMKCMYQQGHISKIMLTGKSKSQKNTNSKIPLSYRSKASKTISMAIQHGKCILKSNTMKQKIRIVVPSECLEKGML